MAATIDAASLASPPVFVITGQLAAGKSTVARALMARFDRGVHIDVDGVREMVVSGLASPLELGDETERQFRLAVEGSVRLAAPYHSGGFAVVIEGGIDPWHAEQCVTELGMLDSFVGVELLPPLEVALERNRTRDNKNFDTAILEGAMRGLDAEMRRRPSPDTWTTIDNGADSLAETVDRIMDLVT